MDRTIIVGSRGSDLALWQAHFVIAQLADAGLKAELKIISTQGDRIQHLSFDKLEGKGFFTKEIEEALLAEEIDLAVHSFKDLPTQSPEGLHISAFSYRENPSDLLLILKDKFVAGTTFNLAEGAVVGTSSARRKGQLLGFRPDLDIQNLRGNVPTRIQKLRDGKYDAIMLAAAGVYRLELELSDFVALPLDPQWFVPAAAQGVLALQIRANDSELNQKLQENLHDKSVAETVEIERDLLHKFDGGCHLPLGIYCWKEENRFKLLTAYAPSVDAIPKRVRLEAESIENLADLALKKVKENTQERVFISRRLGKDNYCLNALTTYGFQVQHEDLIEFKKLPVSEIPTTKWVFFNSVNALNFFLEDVSTLENYQIGVAGTATAQALEAKGYQADFIGKNADPNLNASEFQLITNGGSVLFPCSNISKRTYQKALESYSQVIDLPIYQVSFKNEVNILDADIYAFTSPSNFEALTEIHQIPKNARTIAIGITTAKTMELAGFKPVIANYPDELRIAEAIFSL